MSASFGRHRDNLSLVCQVPLLVLRTFSMHACATELQVSGVNLAGVTHANFWFFSLVISGRFVMRCAERPSTMLAMASAAAPTHQRPPEVRSWHVHRIPKSHIYVQIDFCV